MNKIQGLLKWCQMQLDDYPNVSIKNFSTSWRNGLAFNAIVHKFKPDLINYHGLDPTQIYYNNYKAFKTAEIHFGIPALLDPKDMEIYESPESLSIITYVSQFYNCLKDMKPEGGYKINKFKNTNNGNNSDFENMSRASICKLSKLTCTICLEKVFLLERYVADDKLYHRKCYRNNQIKNIENESEVIGDYLNIYGENNTKLNSNIYVHPIQSFNYKEDCLNYKTSSPVNLLEESESEEDEEEEEYTSESLSSYDKSVNLSHNSSDEDNVIVDDCNLDESTKPGNHVNDTLSKYEKNVFPEYNDFLRPCKSDIDGISLNTEENEILQTQVNKMAEVDTSVNEQDLERNPCTKAFNIKINLSLTEKNEFDKTSNDSIETAKVDNCNLTVTENNIQVENDVLDNNNFELIVTNEIDNKCIKDINEIEGNFKSQEKQEALREAEAQLSELKLRSIKSSTNISPIRPCSQENLIVNLNKTESVKPVKQRLYIKKRDKKLPYSTFFEIPHDKFVCSESQNVSKDNNNEQNTSLKLRNNSDKNVSTCNNDNKESSNINAEILQNKKLIKIHDTVDIECESDVSSIEDEDYNCVDSKIIRNSTWRIPIVTSTVTTKHKSACVPIEGKFRDYAEFKDRLEQLNSKQSEIEIKARKIQQKLWEENSSTPLYESLLAKWLDLVEEKDKIFYEENALYSWIKDLKLQEMKLKLEAQIRLLSTTDSCDSNKNEKEKELIDKLIETVNKRAELVDAMHQENTLRLEIIKNRHEALEVSSLTHDVSPKTQQTKNEKYIKNPKAVWNRKASQF